MAWLKILFIITLCAAHVVISSCSCKKEVEAHAQISDISNSNKAEPLNSLHDKTIDSKLIEEHEHLLRWLSQYWAPPSAGHGDRHWWIRGPIHSDYFCPPSHWIMRSSETLIFFLVPIVLSREGEYKFRDFIGDNLSLQLQKILDGSFHVAYQCPAGCRAAEEAIAFDNAQDARKLMVNVWVKGDTDSLESYYPITQIHKITASGAYPSYDPNNEEFPTDGYVYWDGFETSEVYLKNADAQQSNTYIVSLYGTLTGDKITKPFMCHVCESPFVALVKKSNPDIRIGDFLEEIKTFGLFQQGFQMLDGSNFGDRPGIHREGPYKSPKPKYPNVLASYCTVDEGLARIATMKGDSKISLALDLGDYFSDMLEYPEVYPKLPVEEILKFYKLAWELRRRGKLKWAFIFPYPGAALR